LGDKQSILDAIKKQFLVEYSYISLVGYHNGYNFNTIDVITDIKKNAPDILLVGLGAGRQEKWLLRITICYLEL